MRHKEIIEVVRKRFRKIREVCPRVAARFEAPDIHTLRVEVKKLRAFLRLLAATKGRAGRLRLPRQLQRLYQLAGHIRNLQLQQEHVREACKGKKQNLPKAYLDNLRREEENYILLTARLIRDKLSIEKEEKKLISTLPGHLRTRSRKDLIRAQSARLERLAGSVTPIPDEIMHSIRKLIKDLFYTREYIRREAVLMLPATLLSEKGGRSITRALGEFQDVRTGLQFLQPSYIDNIAAGEERAILDDLKKSWTEEKQRRQEKINLLVINSIHPRPAMP